MIDVYMWPSGVMLMEWIRKLEENSIWCDEGLLTQNELVVHVGIVTGYPGVTRDNPYKLAPPLQPYIRDQRPASPLKSVSLSF